MKFTALTGDVMNVSKLPDRPSVENGYTPKGVKETFDKAGQDIKTYINTTLIEELESKDEGASGADRVGSAPIYSLTGETVQEKLESLSERLNGLANGTIPDGSITPDKFSPEISAFLTSASIRNRTFLESGSFTAERTGTYKITAVGGGAGGGKSLTNYYVPCGGGGGASAIVWLTLAEGDLLELEVGEGGRGLYNENGDPVNASPGGDTVVKHNGTEIMRACGGTIGNGDRARATGGDINISGGFPMAKGIVKLDSTTYLTLDIGGSSLLGEGGAFVGDEVGIGGGGYAGVRSGSNYSDGQDGGKGAVVIEFIS